MSPRLDPFIISLVKRVAFAFAILGLLMGALILGAALAFNAGLFHDAIEARLQNASAMKVKLGAMKIGFPLRLKIQGVQLENEALHVQSEQVELGLESLSPPYSVHVLLIQPTVVVKAQVPKGANAPTPSASKPSASPSAPPLGLTLEIREGRVQWDHGELKALHLQFVQKQLLRSSAALHLKADLSSSQMGLSVPVTLDTDSLVLQPELLKAGQINASLAAINMEVLGASFLQEDRHRWVLKIDAPDLSRLPAPPSFVPGHSWQGAISSQLEVVKAAASGSWQVNSQLKMKDVRAVLSLQQSGVQVKGPIELTADGDFIYAGSEAIKGQLSASVELSSAEVGYQDILHKRAGPALRAKIGLQADGARLIVKNFEAELAQLRAKADGESQLQAPFKGRVHATLEPTTLAGLEQILLPLKSSPVTGELGGEMQMEGSLSEPARAHLRFSSIKLKSFTGQVDYDRPGVLQMRGRVKADLSGDGELQNGEVLSARARGFIDLREAALVLGPLKKNNAQDLSAKFAIANVGRDLNLENLDIQSFVGKFSARGKISTPLKPKLNLTLAASPLNLTELRIAAPTLRDLLPKGEVRSQLQVVGLLQPELPWHQWNLEVKGQVQADLPEYKIVTAKEKPASPSVGAKPAAPPSEAFLPAGPLTQKARLDLISRVARVQKDELVAAGVQMRGRYEAGRFRGEVTVAQVFGGSVRLGDLDVPMLELRPQIRGSAKWNAITLEDALGYADPEYKKLAQGKVSGAAEFSTPMPSEEQFLKALKVRGDFQSQPLTLNTVVVGNLINEQIKKAPLLKISPVKLDPLRGDMSSHFDLQSAAIQLADFVAHDISGSEIQLKGKVLLAGLQGDLIGRFFWADSPARGCVAEGNADDKGRLVLPIAIKGPLMNPSFSILSDVLGRLASRALECEKNKLVDKLKKDGGEKLKQEAEKALKGLFGK